MEDTQSTVELVNQPSEALPQIITAAEAEEIEQAVKTDKLTYTQVKKLRRLYFTIRHDKVTTCGHKIDRMNEPRLNCEFCWFAWFNSHGELVQTADRAFQEQGAGFLDKMRGIKFRKMFVRFMATLAKLKLEQEKENGRSAEGKAEVGGIGGSSTGQAVRHEGDFPKAGEQSGPADTVRADEPAVV